MKGKVSCSTDLRNIFFGTALYNQGIMTKLIQISSYTKSKQAKFRLKVLEFHERYGTEATIDSFEVSKSTIYRWRKAYIESNKDLRSLIPKSRSPKNKRTMMVDYRLIDFIRDLRRKWRIGKEKIKPLLDEYCQEEGLITISESTIGKVIKRYDLFYSPDKSYQKRRKNVYKEKVKKSPKVDQLGYIEIDTIEIFIHGLRRYIYNAIDIKLRFQFSYAYHRANSKNGLDFFKKLERVYPIKNGIHTVQTDNGSEFKSVFDRYLRTKGIIHKWIYPRCPRINGYIERANRTLQDEFINHNQHLIIMTKLDRFNAKLAEYLVWYNTKRVHKGLKNVSPIVYLLKLSPESHMYVTYT